MHFYGTLWVLINPYASLRILMVLMHLHWSSLVLISPDASLWVLVGPYGS